jgi:hypothetical protein
MIFNVSGWGLWKMSVVEYSYWIFNYKIKDNIKNVCMNFHEFIHNYDAQII